MKKRFFAILLVMLMCLSLLPVSAMAADLDVEDPMPGAWVRAEDTSITPERQALFEKALDGLDGVAFTPISYAASQLVSGVNHLFVADRTVFFPDAETDRVLVYIHEDLEGNAAVTDIVETTPEASVGSWVQAEDISITPERQAIFEKAVAGIVGTDYAPIAYLASQVVSGANHLFVADRTGVYPDAATSNVLMYIYEDLKGNAEVTDIVEMVMGDEPVAGGWVQAEDSSITPERQALFEKAFEGIVGADYTPVSYVAWQIVSGTNHLFVADCTGVYPNAEPARVLVYIHEDLDGNAEVYDIVDAQVDPERPFEDVDTDDWFYDAVYYCYDNGYFKGDSDTAFNPDGDMTRAMFTTVLYRFVEEPEAEGVVPFEDVSAYEYYTGAVIWAAGNEIIMGYGNGKFGPDDPITREQIAVILWRNSGSPEIDGVDLSGYKDADEISDWARSAVEWAVSMGILQGSKSRLNPGDVATRAEVAQLMYNLGRQLSRDSEVLYTTENGIQIRELAVYDVGGILHCFSFRLSNPTDKDAIFYDNLFQLTTADGTKIATAAPYVTSSNVKAGLQYYMVSITILSPELLSLGDEVTFYYDGTLLGTAVVEYWDISDHGQDRSSEPVYTTADGIEVRDLAVKLVNSFLYNFQFTLSNPTDQDALFEDAWFTLTTPDGEKIATSAPYFSPNKVTAGTTYYRISVPIQSTALLNQIDEVLFYCQGNYIGTVAVEK